MTRDLLTLVANFKPGMQVGGIEFLLYFPSKITGPGKDPRHSWCRCYIGDRAGNECCSIIDGNNYLKNHFSA